MKLTIDKGTLTGALANVSRAVQMKSPMPALEGILFEAAEGKLRLSGYDLEMGITTEVDADVKEAGSIVLSARLITDIVRRVPDSRVLIETDEKNLAQIRSGRSGYKLMGIAAVEYPEMPKPDPEGGITFPQYLLKDMIAQTRYAVATSDTMPVHKGSLFVLENGVFDLVSVDGCRLAMREEPYVCDTARRFIVPGKTLNDIEKMLTDDRDSNERVEVFLSAKHIVFAIGNYRVVTRLLEGNFLDYRNAIPKAIKTTATVNTREMIESVERAALIVDDRLKNPLKCRFENGSISISVNTAMGHAEDAVDCAMEGETVEIGFNAGYLLESLKNAGCERVTLQLLGPLAPMKIVPAEGSSFTFLVLPVRIRG